MFVLDSHCDTPSQILRLRNLAADDPHSHVDFPKLKRGGVDGAFFALYVPAKMEEEEAYTYARRLLMLTQEAIAENGDKAAFAVSRAQAVGNKVRGLFSVFLGLENASPIGKSLPRLREFYEAGVRYVTLCHSSANEICDSCASQGRRWGGLSPFGRTFVAEMNRLGMLIDVSHISDEAFHDVLNCSSAPVVATHSCCRALAQHPRNMTDEMIRLLAASGGVMQINFYPVFLDSRFAEVLSSSGIEERGDRVEEAFIAAPHDAEKRAAWYDILDELSALERPSYKSIVDHIDHVVSLVGIDHVGLGSDFDGIAVTPDGLENVSKFSLILDEMRSRGYSEADIEKVAGGNFFRVMDQVTAVSSQAHV